MGCAKVAEQIKVLFRVKTPYDARNILVDRREYLSTSAKGVQLTNYFGHLFTLLKTETYAVVYIAVNFWTQDCHFVCYGENH